jgi:hypothetical protein
VRSYGTADPQIHVEIDAPDAAMVVCGTAATPYLIVDITSAAPISAGRFPLNTHTSGCSGETCACPPDASYCADLMVVIPREYGYVTAFTTGTVDIAAYDRTHVAGTFDVSEALPDGGNRELSGSFDAPSCLVTPPIPIVAHSCGGEGWDDGVFPGDFSLWLVAVYRGMRSWRVRKRSDSQFAVEVPR